MQVTICFVEPYWIALVEAEKAGLYYAARFIFGVEPSMEEVYAFVLSRDYTELLGRMTLGIPSATSAKNPVNPKRLQRQIRRELQTSGISSRSQEALRLQIEAGKQERRILRKDNQEAEAAYKRERKIAKRKEKQRGH